MKNYRLIAVAAAALILLAGCSSDKAEENSVPAAASAQTEYVMQEGDTQVIGEVTEIVGNEVTLALGELEEKSQGGGNGEKPEMPEDGSMPEMGENGEMPEMPEGGNMPEMGENGEMPEGGSMPEMGENGEMPEMPEGGNMPEMGENGEMPQMGEGGKGGKSGKSSASVNKSGETASYIIPVGMTVSGASGRDSDYSAISVGNVLRLTVNSEGYVVAAEIV